MTPVTCLDTLSIATNRGLPMDKLVENLDKLANKDGYNPTALKGIGVFKATKSTERVPLCYSQGIIIMAQGSKRVYLDQQAYDYNPNNYLVLTLPMPAECETLVEDGKPLFSLMMDFDLGLLNELVRLFDEHQKIKPSTHQAETKGLFVCQCTDPLLDSVLRLSQCLNSPLECDVMGKSLIREVMYHILQGPQAAPMFALVSHNTSLSRLDRVLKYLHNNYQSSLDVEQLASMANMSSSTFHRNFRQVTSSSPIQYVKKIRLNRAKELLLDQGLKVKQAATQVGYESPTQFSREFTRYFGQSPRDCARL